MRSSPVFVPVALAVAVWIASGCGDRHPRQDADDAGLSDGAGGTVVIATPADADALFPPVVTGVTGRQVTDLVFDRLAEIGEGLNTVGDAGFRARLARRWTWAPDSLSIAFHLDPGARWHDGEPVRAADVRFTHRVYTDPAVASPSAESLRNIDSVTVGDSLTAVVWFRRRAPEQFYDATAHMRILPAHQLRRIATGALAHSEFSRRPVGSGRFRLVRWIPGDRIELVADVANYRGRARLDRVIWTVAADPAAAAVRLFTREADVFEGVRPEHLPELAQRPALTTASYPGLQYGYLQFNLVGGGGAAARPHPLFGDRALRRALTMALDRRAMVRNVFDTLGTVALGPFTRAQATADTAVRQLPFDPAAAARALDSLGWRDTDADGVRERGRQRLAFRVLVPTSSVPRLRMAQLAQAQWRRVGVRADVEALEFTTFADRFGRRRFDTAIGVWFLDPSPASVRDLWGSVAARAPGGLNYGGYASAAFDTAVDSALAAPTAAAARPHFRRAYQTIIDDAPAVWLFEPRPVLGLHGRLRIVSVRPDAWWAGLADWWVPPAQWTARDSIGLGLSGR